MNCGHAHRAVGADAAEVVAAEVDEHDVLGAFLLVALQLLAEAQVLLVRPAARPRAGDRMGLGLAALDADEHLGRRADDRQFADAREVHVRRRVHVAQRAIDGERVGLEVDLEALRQHHLVDVAPGDVLLRHADVAFEVLAARERADGRRLGAGRAAGNRLCVRLFELPLQEVEPRIGELVQRRQVVGRRDAGVGDEQDPVLDVVERQHRVEQHERRFVARVLLALVLLPHVLEGRLEPRRRVVAEEPDGAAGESRQPGDEGRPVLGHDATQRRDEALVERGGLAALLDHRLAVARPQHEERVLAEERVARHLLAALDALEQERVIGMFRDAKEGRHRREQVGEEFAAHRHERAAAGEVDEFVEGGLGHRGHEVSSASCGASAWMAARIASTGGSTGNQVATCTAAWAISISRPPSVSQPAAAASRSRRVRPGL